MLHSSGLEIVSTLVRIVQGQHCLSRPTTICGSHVLGYKGRNENRSLLTRKERASGGKWLEQKGRGSGRVRRGERDAPACSLAGQHTEPFFPWCLFLSKITSSTFFHPLHRLFLLCFLASKRHVPSYPADSPVRDPHTYLLKQEEHAGLLLLQAIATIHLIP